MNPKQKKNLGEQISRAAYILKISPSNDTSYNFNWGFLTALCIAAETAGMPQIEIDEYKRIGENR
jgi:hypothetical protein